MQATQCPLPIKASIPLFSGCTSNSTTALSTDGVTQNSSISSLYANELAARHDLSAMFSGSVYSVISGMTVSVSGSYARVAAGLCNIGGFVELPASGSILINTSAMNYLWFGSDLTLVKTATITPPNSYSCFVGSVSGTTVSYDGVCYNYGGIPIRKTTDTVAPGDTPTSGTCFYTATTSGLYFYSGARYYKLADNTL
mgnify:CR=1 FL=1